MKKFLEQIKNDRHKILVLKDFMKKTSVNVSGVTFWHSIDDILNMKIPIFVQNNFSETKLKMLKKWGFKIE